MFLLRKGEVEGRLDVEFYTPEILKLEYKIKKISTLRLKDFVKKIASGATPLTTEAEKYYVESAAEGVPFLRVQNLSTSGILQIEDCKFINRETHDTMLNRSKVQGGDLLVKITGVGRMAIASVAPEGFEGNINQHVVVIKTKDRTTSEVLAAYLNTDISERLATRRATGGTRPALDYPALLSMPIIFDEKILEITREAIALQQNNKQKAKTLLASINAYLLDALDITLPPEPAKTWQNQMYLTDFYSVNGGRFDPNYNDKYFINIENSIKNSSYKSEKLGNLITDLKNGIEIREYVTQEEDSKAYRYLRVTDMTKDGISDKSIKLVSTDEIPTKIKLTENSILISRSGSLGLANTVEGHIMNAILSSHIFKVEIDINKIINNFLVEIIRSTIGQLQVFRQNNGGVIPEINQDALKSLLIPIPPKTEQGKIASHIRTIREEAKALRVAGDKAMEEAKAAVEKILLKV